LVQYEGPFPLTKNFHRTENFPKISLLKVENFQLQNFLPKEIYVGQSHFTKFSFCGNGVYHRRNQNKPAVFRGVNYNPRIFEVPMTRNFTPNVYDCSVKIT
jgi:hypothetical protein